MFEKMLGSIFRKINGTGDRLRVNNLIHKLNKKFISTNTKNIT
jgi:hypothetical protein